MDVPAVVWWLTVVGIVGLLVFDFVFHVRTAHVPTLREAAIWSSAYVGIALAFGIGVWIVGGGEMGAAGVAGPGDGSAVRTSRGCARVSGGRHQAPTKHPAPAHDPTGTGRRCPLPSGEGHGCFRSSSATRRSFSARVGSPARSSRGRPIRQSPTQRGPGDPPLARGDQRRVAGAQGTPATHSA